MLKVLLCGGGSIGHLAPSVAVWEALERKGDIEALFVCSSRKDEKLFLKKLSLQSKVVHAPKASKSPLLLFFPLFFLVACIESFSILSRFKPNVIFSKGGYVSVPVSLMGWLMRIPIVLHESDRVLGKANSFLLHFAKHLCIGTPQKNLENDDSITKKGIPSSATGNPVREMVLAGSKDAGNRITTFSGKRPVLMVWGGSQGAQVLNNAVYQHLMKLVEFADIIHLTGRKKGKPELSHARYFQREFADEDLPHLFALADVVISRAGAGAIAELSAAGKAIILVPIPDLASKHQEENARFLEVAGAAVVLKQDSLEETFLSTVSQLLNDDQKKAALAERLYAFATPEAAERIANILLECAKR